MSALARTPSLALAFAMDGDRVRRAANVLEKERGRLESALRRAVPFLARRGIPVTLGYAKAMPLSAVLQDIEAPIHVTRLAVQPGDGRGAMVFDAGVLALLLDGVLGGDGTSTPKLESEGLTPPQFAVVQGVVTTILRALGETLHTRLGVRLEPLPGTGPNAEAGGEGVPVACALDLSTREGERIGRVVLLLPKESLLHVTGGAEQGAAPKADPRIVAALDDVSRRQSEQRHLSSVEVGRFDHRGFGEVAERQLEAQERCVVLTFPVDWPEPTRLLAFLAMSAASVGLMDAIAFLSRRRSMQAA